MKSFTGLLFCWLLLVHAAPARAQDGAQDTIIYGVRAPRWAGHMTAAATNALLGGITAGVFQELRGGSFKDGFTRGSLGGGVSYIGKRIAGRRFDGAGLLGREIAAVGSSIVRNAGDARPTFERVVLPLGPLRFHLLPASKQFSHVSIDVVGTGWLIWAVLEPELELAGSETLSAGAPVFRTNNKILVHTTSRTHSGGFTPSGVILQAWVPAYGEPFLTRVLSHERVHVLQEDYFYQTLLEPGESWLMGKLPRGRTIDRYVDINVSTELLGVLTLLFPKHSDRPWEIEANYLSR